MRWRMRRSHHSISWGALGGWVLEDAPEEEALHLHLEEGLVDVGGSRWRRVARLLEVVGPRIWSQP